MSIPQGIKRVICLFLAACFFFQNTLTCYGQALVPVLTPPVFNFNPPTLKYLSVNSANPNNYFNFLLDKGQSPQGTVPVTNASLENEAKKLIHYFFIGLTLPESSLWVNLRPDEPGRITSLELAQTDMGKLLLKQDLRLKKDVAQYLNPSQPIGKRFWEELYTQAELLLGKGKLKKTAITTSNRVWIVPDEAVVMETEDGALVTQAKLKVLLESEYLSLKSKSWNKEVEVQVQNKDQLKNLTEALMKSIVIPEITKEVNSGQSYAPLRQIYHSLILAQWFKQKYRKQKENSKDIPYIEAIDQSWLKGLESEFPWSKDAIWQEYLASFQKGEYQLKEKLAGLNRMYTSGGIAFFAGSGSSNLVAFPYHRASLPLANSPTERENAALVVIGDKQNPTGNALSPDIMAIDLEGKESSNEADASSPILVEEKVGRILGSLDIHKRDGMPDETRWVRNEIFKSIGLSREEGHHLLYALHNVHRYGKVPQLLKNPVQAIRDVLADKERMRKELQDPKSGAYGYESLRYGEEKSDYAIRSALQAHDEEIKALRGAMSTIGRLPDSKVAELLDARTLFNIYYNLEFYAPDKRMSKEDIEKIAKAIAAEATHKVDTAGEDWKKEISDATANVARSLPDDQREMVRRLSFATSTKAVAWLLNVKAIDVKNEITQLAQDHWARDDILNALKEGGNANAVGIKYVLYFHAKANTAWAGTRAADPRPGRNDPVITPMLKSLRLGLIELYNKELADGESQRLAFAKAVLMFHLDALELQKGLASLPIMETSSLGPPEVNLHAKEVDASLSILNREKIGRTLRNIDRHSKSGTHDETDWVRREIFEALGLSPEQRYYISHALDAIHKHGEDELLSKNPAQAIENRIAYEERMREKLQDPKSDVYGYESLRYGEEKSDSAIYLALQGIDENIRTLRGVIRKINGLSDSEISNLIDPVTLRNIYNNAKLLSLHGRFREEYTMKNMKRYAAEATHKVDTAGEDWKKEISDATANVARSLPDDQREMVRKLSFATSTKAVSRILNVEAIDVTNEIMQLAQDHLARDGILDALKEEGNADAVNLGHVLYLHALANSTWAGTRAADPQSGRNDPATTPMLKGLKPGLTELYDKALRDGKSQRQAFAEVVLSFHFIALELQKGLASSPLTDRNNKFESLIDTLTRNVAEWPERNSAIIDLGGLVKYLEGEKREKAISVLIKVLTSESEAWEVCYSAAKVLKKLGWKPENREEDARLIYLIAMERWNEIKKYGKSAVNPLIGVLKRLPDDETMGIVSVLGDIGDPGAIPTLLNLLQGQDQLLRFVVVKNLGKIGDPVIIPDLFELFQDPDPYVRDASVEALDNVLAKRTIDDSRVMPALLKLLQEDPRPSIIYFVAAALVKIGDPGTIPALRKLLQHINPSVAIAATEVLTKVGGTGIIPDLLQLLKQYYGPIRAAAAENLGNILDKGTINDSGAVLALFNLLQDSKPDVREAATRALSKILDKIDVLGIIGESRVIAALVELMQDTGRYVRTAAFKALGKIMALKVNLNGLTLASQSLLLEFFLKRLISSKGEFSEDMVKETAGIARVLRWIDKVHGKYPSLGAEVHYPVKDRMGTEEMSELFNMLSSVSIEHGIGVPEYDHEEMMLDLRTLPGSPIVFERLFRLFDRLGVFTPQTGEPVSYHTSIRGDFSKEAPFFIISSVFLDWPTFYSLALNMFLSSGEDSLAFAGAHTYAGVTMDPVTGEEDPAGQTNIYDKYAKIAVGDTVFGYTVTPYEKDLRRKALLAVLFSSRDSRLIGLRDKFLDSLFSWLREIGIEDADMEGLRNGEFAITKGGGGPATTNPKLAGLLENIRIRILVKALEEELNNLKTVDKASLSSEYKEKLTMTIKAYEGFIHNPAKHYRGIVKALDSIRIAKVIKEVTGYETLSLRDLHEARSGQEELVLARLKQTPLSASLRELEEGILNPVLAQIEEIIYPSALERKVVGIFRDASVPLDKLSSKIDNVLIGALFEADLNLSEEAENLIQEIGGERALDALRATAPENDDAGAFLPSKQASASSPLEREGKTYSSKDKEENRMALKNLIGLLQGKNNADIDGIDQMLSDESILLAIPELEKLHKVLTGGIKRRGMF